MRKLIVACLLLAGAPVSAQVQVRFRLLDTPSGKNADSVFVAGSFNGWNPAATNFRFVPEGAGPPSVLLDTEPGVISYKLTRGSWNAVETDAGGQDRENRTLKAARDTTVDIRVLGWKDAFAARPQVSTALGTVRLLSEGFPMPQLGRQRRVWVCLPRNYAAGTKRYPVLYMHDGQNLFDRTTAGFGEWGVDEALDSLQQKIGGIIIVGIDHGGSKRLNEYSPYDMERFGKGEGSAYTDFLVQTLKPYIDSAFRTRPGRVDTYIAGSSMGGLISMYAILRYPDVFGGAGVFSPAFWVAPDLKRDVLRWGAGLKGRVYFYAGEEESKEMVPDMLRIFQLLRQQSRVPMQTVIRSEGKHNEAAWQKEFPAFIEWITKKPPQRPMPKF